MPIVTPELQLLEIQREEFFKDAMVFYQPFLGETPESLQTGDIGLAARKVLSVIYGEVPVPTTHKRIIGLVFVRINDTSTPDLFDGQLQKSLSLAVWDTRSVDVCCR